MGIERDCTILNVKGLTLGLWEAAYLAKKGETKKSSDIIERIKEEVNGLKQEYTAASIFKKEYDVDLSVLYNSIKEIKKGNFDNAISQLKDINKKINSLYRI